MDYVVFTYHHFWMCDIFYCIFSVVSTPRSPWKRRCTTLRRIMRWSVSWKTWTRHWQFWSITYPGQLYYSILLNEALLLTVFCCRVTDFSRGRWKLTGRTWKTSDLWTGTFTSHQCQRRPKILSGKTSPGKSSSSSSASNDSTVSTWPST